MKDRLKAKLESDEHCASLLEKIYEKDISFDTLWADRFYSLVSVILILTSLLFNI
jgi:hypothetical protein